MKYAHFVISVVLLAAIVAAVTWSPQGNIDLKNLWNMTNLSYFEEFSMIGNIIMNGYNISGAYNITADYFYGDGSGLTNLPITVDTSAYVNCTADEVFLGNGSCWSSSVFFDDTTIGNCSVDGSCPLITYDSELSYTVDTSAYVNCTADEVFLGNGTCWSSSVFFDDTTIGNCSADGSCPNIIYVTDEADLNVNSSDFWDNLNTPADLEDLVLLKYQNITNLPTCTGTDKYTYDGTTLTCDTDETAATVCSGTTTYLDGNGNCDDISGVYVDETGDFMTGNLNVTNNNVTGLNYLKFTYGGYIYDNGTDLILGHD